MELQAAVDDLKAMLALEEYERFLAPVEDHLKKVGPGNPHGDRYGE